MLIADANMMTSVLTVTSQNDVSVLYRLFKVHNEVGPTVANQMHVDLDLYSNRIHFDVLSRWQFYNLTSTNLYSNIDVTENMTSHIAKTIPSQ